MTWHPDKPHPFDPSYAYRSKDWCICGRHRLHSIHKTDD